jgi:hypothetical protein
MATRAAAPDFPKSIVVNIDEPGRLRSKLKKLLEEAAAGKYDEELRSRGIKLPPGMKGDAIKFAPEHEQGQGVSPDQVVELAIIYGPLVVTIGKSLWIWAWSKLQDSFPDVQVKNNSKD